MKKVTKKSNARQPHPGKRLIILIFSVIVCVGLLSWYLIAHTERQRAIEKQRTQFIQADAQLSKLADQIVAKFGQPLARQTNNSCKYTSNPDEFERGDLSCSVDRVDIYKTYDSDSAHALSSELEQYIISLNEIRFNKISSPFDGTTPPINIATQTFKSATLQCIVDYTYFSHDYPTGVARPQGLMADSGLIIEAGCTSPSLAAYYPMVH